MPRFAPRSEHLRSPDCACNPGSRFPDIASLIRATTRVLFRRGELGSPKKAFFGVPRIASPLRKGGRRVLLFGHTRRGKRQGGVRFARYYVPASQFEHVGSEGLGWCVYPSNRSWLGGISHGYQDGSGAGAAVRLRSSADRSVERDNCRHRFGIAHSVRVIASVARMSACDIRGYATAVPGFRKRSSGLRSGYGEVSPAAGRRVLWMEGDACIAPTKLVARAGVSRCGGLARRRVRGYLCVGRLPSGCKRSVRAWRGTGGRARQQ